MSVHRSKRVLTVAFTAAVLASASAIASAPVRGSVAAIESAVVLRTGDVGTVQLSQATPSATAPGRVPAATPGTAPRPAPGAAPTPAATAPGRNQVSAEPASGAVPARPSASAATAGAIGPIASAPGSDDQPPSVSPGTK